MQYFILVLCFIAVQVVYAIAGFMSGTNWILEALEKSWDRAYNTDKGLIRDLQIEVRGSRNRHLVGGNATDLDSLLMSSMTL